MSNIIFGGNGSNAKRCSDVDLEPDEAIREAFAVMLRTDEGIDFGEVLGQCGLSRRATKTLTDREARLLIGTLKLALEPAVVSERVYFFEAVCKATGNTIAELAKRSQVHPDALEAFCRGEGTLSRPAFKKASEAALQMAVPEAKSVGVKAVVA